MTNDEILKLAQDSGLCLNPTYDDRITLIFAHAIIKATKEELKKEIPNGQVTSD